jgi:hypothetical protein
VSSGAEVAVQVKLRRYDDQALSKSTVLDSPGRALVGGPRAADTVVLPATRRIEPCISNLAMEPQTIVIERKRQNHSTGLLAAFGGALVELLDAIGLPDIRRSPP